MRWMAILVLSNWIAVIGSIALFTLFWRTGYICPHFLWGVLSLVAIFVLTTWLAVSALWRCVRGPDRLRSLGWLLVGATPLVWTSAYVVGAIIDLHGNPNRALNAPVRVAAVWGSTVFEMEARWRYPRRTRGQHVVLIDNGRTPAVEQLVAQMDDHVEAMANVLGQPVLNQELPWVHGSLFGVEGRAIYLWAICCNRDEPETPGELAYVDRHEIAHTFITSLGGPDQHPPSVLQEGWAESQSSDRNHQIRALARDHRRGLTLSLQDHVQIDRYDERTTGRAYEEGAPLVHYLIERFGGGTFLRFYTDVRRDSFHDDCRAILGVAWEEVEEDFWKWVEAEDQLLSESDAKQPEAHVELGPSVDRSDWQALVEGYREANKDLQLPSCIAFVLEGVIEKKETSAPTLPGPRKFECRAIFEDRELWIFDNGCRYGEDDWFLLATYRCCGQRIRSDSGPRSGEVRQFWAPCAPREGATELLAFYREEANQAFLLPFQQTPRADMTYRIERVDRPTVEKPGLWKVKFTREDAGHDEGALYDVEMDSAKRWWTTRVVGEDRRSCCRLEMDAEYEAMGDAIMPVTLHARYRFDEGELTIGWRVKAMSKVEQQELKRRVEQAVRSTSRALHVRVRFFLLVIVIVCPVVGAGLLVLTRHASVEGR